MSRNQALRRRIKNTFDQDRYENIKRPSTRSPKTPQILTPSPRTEVPLKVKNLRNIIKEEKKLQQTNDFFSRDISHLQDRKMTSFMSLPILPTDLCLLKKLKQCEGLSEHTNGRCRRETCINEACLNLTKSQELDQPDSIDKIFIGNPSGRQEIKELSTWFNSMLVLHQDSNIETIGLIYDYCAKEITRQVAVSCIERGELLQVLFKYQADVYNRKEEELLKTHAGEIQLYEKEVKNIQEAIMQRQKELENQLAEQEKKIEELEGEKKSLKEDLGKSRGKLNEFVRRYMEEETRWNHKQHILLMKLKDFYKIDKTGYHQMSVVKWVNRNRKLFSEKDFDEIGIMPELEPGYMSNVDQQLNESDLWDSYIRNLNERGVNKDSFNISSGLTVSLTENLSVSPLRKDRSLSTDYQEPIKIFPNKKDKSKKLLKKKTAKKGPKNSDLKSRLSIEKFKLNVNSAQDSFSHSFRLDDLNKEDLNLDEIFPKGFDFHSWKTGFWAGYEKGRKDGMKEGELLTIEEREFQNPDKSSSSEEDCGSDRKPLSRGTSLKSYLFQRKIKDLTRFNQFNFNHPSGPKKQHPAYSLYTKLLMSRDDLNSKCSLSRKIINKMITSTLLNSLSKQRTGEAVEALFEQLYDDFYQKYGLKSVSEKRFGELVNSLFWYTEYRRVSSFVRLLGFGARLGLRNYSKRGVGYYLSTLDYMMSSKIGVVVVFDEIADRQMFPTIRGVMCVREKTEWFAAEEKVTETVTTVLRASEDDRKGINPHGLVELELVLMLVTDQYEDFVQDIEEGVFLLTEAFGKEDEVSSYEISMWARHLNCGVFGVGEKSKNFKAFAEELESKEFYSIYETCSVCIENKVLRLSDIRKIEDREVTNEELLQKYEDIKKSFFEFIVKIERSSFPQDFMSEVHQFIEIFPNSFDAQRRSSVNSIALHIVELEFNRLKEESGLGN